MELVRRTDPRREPRWLVSVTFALGAVAAAVALLVTDRAAARTGLDVRVSAAGETGALVFLFFVVAPIQEAAKVAAAWPAFLSKHLDQAVRRRRLRGGVRRSGSRPSRTRSSCEPTLPARSGSRAPCSRCPRTCSSPASGATRWRAPSSRSAACPSFPAAFVATIAAHGLYAHFVYGRGPGALLAVTPLLAVMGVVAWMLGRDLRTRGERPSTRCPRRRAGGSARLSQPPSLSAVRSALRRADEPVKVRWIVLGALVTLGAMIVGLAGGVVAAHVLHIDLSTVNEHELTTAAPALLLGMGLLGSFPTSGWLVARAADVRTLLEPALASVLALVITLVALGFAAPFAVVFGLAISPIAWVLSCAGAWVAGG